jgi:heat shock protein HtpX
MGNAIKTGLLLVVLTAIFVLVGRLVGGKSGMVIAFGMAVAMNFFSYWFSDRMVLSMYGAQEISESDDPRFYGIVRRLAIRAGLPMPKVYLIDSETPNAFATGRNPQHAAVAATTGILRILSEDELAGVMAHELAHVKNRDILIQTVAACSEAAAMTMMRGAASSA